MSYMDLHVGDRVSTPYGVGVVYDFDAHRAYVCVDGDACTFDRADVGPA